MRKFKAPKNKMTLVILISLGVAVIVAAVILVKKYVLNSDAEGCDCCEEDDEFRDENGCCYTDEKDFVQK
jgi:hypothetical protein